MTLPNTATGIVASIRNGECSTVDVTKAFLARQDAVNPLINAVVQPMTDDALAQAAAVDAALARGDALGPLAGVPVTIKVNVDQEGYATTNGVRAQQDTIATTDSPFVARMRAAGCVFVGRTNTPAFSLRWFTRNQLHGQTLNPRNTALTPGGSSGGAAAAVAAGLCAVGHGTDIAGSIRYPAYACGVHGLRPTFGRVPTLNETTGDRFIGAQLMAVSGPITRTIEDLRLAYYAMCGPDPRDPWSVPVPLDTRSAGSKRAALCLEPEGHAVAPILKAALTQAAHALESAGWTIEDVPCPPLREAADINAVLWMAETQFAQKAAIEGEADPDAMFVFDQMCRDVGAVDLERVMTALRRRSALIREWEAFFDDYAVLLLAPSGELPFEQQLDVRSEADFARVYEAQLTQRALPTLGLPAMSVATGHADTHPLGVQLVAGRFQEATLFSAAEAIEAHFGAPDIATPSTV